MPAQRGNLLHHASAATTRDQFSVNFGGPLHVVDVDLRVTASSGQPVAVGIPANLGNSVLVRVQILQQPRPSRIPQLDDVVSRSRGNQALALVPRDRLHLCTVSPQNGVLRRQIEIPNLDQTVVRAGGKLVVGRRKPSHAQ